MMDSPKCPFGAGPPLPLTGARKVRFPILACFLIHHFQSLELTVLLIDYKITPYIAEFANTVTNAFFSKNPSPSLVKHSFDGVPVSLALFGLRNSIRQKYHPWFIATEMGFLLVGVGSWLFHATLLYQVRRILILPADQISSNF